MWKLYYELVILGRNWRMACMAILPIMNSVVGYLHKNFYDTISLTNKRLQEKIILEFMTE